MDQNPIHVLLVEDNPLDARFVVGLLKEDHQLGDFRIYPVTSLRDALSTLSRGRETQIILLDLGLPDEAGLQTLRRIVPMAHGASIVVLTAHHEEEMGIAALREGAHDYLIKGQVEGRQLRRVLRYALERQKMWTELRAEIAGRARAQHALEISEQRYRLLFDSAPMGILTADGAGIIVDANAQALLMFGYRHEELIGKRVEALLPERLRKSHEGQRTAYTRDPHPRPMGVGIELFGRRKNGDEFPVEISLGPLVTKDGILISSAIVEITARKKMEQQLHAAQRMEAIGQLAGGVAHDFNNLLGVILGQSEILLDRSKHEEERHGLQMIKESAQRGAALTLQLLAFAKRQVLEPRILNLNTVLHDVEKLLRRLIGENIELDFHTEAKLGRLKADPSQIEQVILNLAINARDAMPRGGKLVISTANVNLDEGYGAHHAPVRPGRYVQLTVSDTGCGMDEETQSHIFEPFFTTKEVGKGTGLGLATVYGMVKQNGGYIWLYSELGCGTVFKIYLPMTETSAETPSVIERGEPSPQGSETILVVEDDASLLEVTSEFLQRSGYRVIKAAEPRDALRLAEQHNGQIHLLVTDVTMPGMNGRELATQLIAKSPQTKVLYVSGYTDGIVKDGTCGVLDDGLAFLQKPFTRDALTRKVREILDLTPANSTGKQHE